MLTPIFPHLKGKLIMAYIRSFLRACVAVAAACVALCGTARATVIYDGNLTIRDTDPMQSWQLRLSHTPQDWSNSESFPGITDYGAPYFHYATLDLDVAALEAGSAYGQFLQVSFDSATTYTFLAAYLDSYAPTQWLGDAGNSGNSQNGTNPRFFQVVVPADHHLVLGLYQTAWAYGLGEPGGVLVEAFSDTMYSDLAPVPEPATWALMAAGLVLVSAGRKRAFHIGGYRH